MRVSDFTYELPENLIAQHPPKERGASRLLVKDKSNGDVEHRSYADMVEYLNPGDVVVLNDTRVIKARLLAKNTKGQSRELLLLEDHHSLDAYTRKVLYRGKLRQGEILKIADNEVTVEAVLDGGITKISSTLPLLSLAEHVGTVPLPPYMHREATLEDIQRYQTVFAREPGSVAAPTASLNFTKDLEYELRAKGVQIVYLTLHVGLGTFLPIRSDEIEAHDMHSEHFEIPKETIEIIRKAKLNSSGIVAIGTTVARTLEYAANNSHLLSLKKDGPFTAFTDSTNVICGEADIFIYPGYEFKVIDKLLTNFHAPKSTVLMLAAAFASWSNLESAYQEAIKEKYAFLSYGDSMLII
ncbi:tRNA preQ1(34) S-adenosylmethionine ribosyltransferase-isomerase QueA [Candidatus Saccharibacteria bacterium]|nr:tRNA preQ1(34) S-adenosylmethionine ribosyltransferase-isomerase QueA [Candidatus Saccharibacteria bacterium]